MEKILQKPHITEKATELAKSNQYIFKVSENSNKPEIKKAIEDSYKVKVLSVKIIKIHAKNKSAGRIVGWQKGYKKAIVRIKAGQKIEISPQ